MNSLRQKRLIMNSLRQIVLKHYEQACPSNKYHRYHGKQDKLQAER